MAGSTTVPSINKRYACVTSRNAAALAAVISSYLFEPGSYFPVFLFPRVELCKSEDPAFMSEDYVANMMADGDSVGIWNALARMGKLECVILAGLTDAQKSHLELPKQTTTIEIADLSEVQLKLSCLPLLTNGEIRCKPADLLNGLYVAQKRKKRLVIDESARAVPEVVDLQKGMIVVENVLAASAIIAINYAHSVGASLLVVDALAKDEGRSISRWVQDWKQKDDHAQFQKLKDAAQRRIAGVSFAQFDYATFFTEGVPYALILENIIPCSHVHLSLKPDHLIFSSLVFEDGKHSRGAVVFSPVFFQDEETNWLIDFFSSSKYYVRALTGKEATLANFDFHVQHFPYDLLHICSHGGEVDGYEMTEQFIDRDGNTHVIEFDEVVGFTPVQDKPDMLEVHRKVFPRKLDGADWMSEELKRRNLPKHVSLDMWKCMLQSKGQRKNKKAIATSCTVACVDSIHQGQFHALASHSSPLVFNNTCWSWSEVASFFLACGARGYIGTLWAIDNQAAIVAAKTFYEHLFFGSVLNALHKATRAIATSESKNIYVYWGLHFTKLSPGENLEGSQSRVGKELIRAVEAWTRKIEITKSVEVRQNSVKALNLILRELLSNFDSREAQALQETVRQRVQHVFQGDISRGTEESDIARLRSMEGPIEYRSVRREDKTQP